MKFYDKVKIHCTSGKGGNGAVSARRELYIPYGGPAGGNGGKGGDIIFVSAINENTLINLRYQQTFKAKDGEGGQIKDKYGKSADDLRILVPVGTIIKRVDNGEVVHHFVEDGEEFIALKGGHGGAGNMHFATSTLQYPNFALLGEPAQFAEFELELQLLGDIALIGTPSVGKSTIINAISNVKAKVADYPFTTLVPNLGSVDAGFTNYNVIDIPGLIEGASQGRGLGNDFLRHVIKAKVFAFVIDITRFEPGCDEFGLLFDEIVSFVEQKFISSSEFGKKINQIDFDVKRENEKRLLVIEGTFEDGEKIVIMQKHLCIVINKIDMIDDEEIQQEFKKYITKKISDKMSKWIDSKTMGKILSTHIFEVSGIARINTDLLIKQRGDRVVNDKFSPLISYDRVAVTKKRGSHIEDSTEKYIPILLSKGMIEQSDVGDVHVFSVVDEEVARLVWMVPRGNDEGENRFRRVCEKNQFKSKMDKNGIRLGDIMRFESPYLGQEDRFIRVS